VLVTDDAVDVALGLLLVTALVPIVLIDLERRLIPNAITLPAAIAGAVAILVLDIDFIVEALIAAAAAGGFFLLAAVLYPRGMGMGDVKLSALLGLYLGRAVGPALFAALILGVLVGAAIIARKGAVAGRKTAVPFGPFLALGGVLGFFVGDDIANAYIDRF
jgi:leader peptidase (prepilin peptidase)/N-methyltransferase